MIKLEKQKEPEVLLNNKTTWEDSYKKTGKIPQKSYNHANIKKSLLKETNKKCAYCERILPDNELQVEHILPKSVKKYKKNMFEWENLTLACTTCNQKKSDYFDNGINMDLSVINPYKDRIPHIITFDGPMIMPSKRVSKDNRERILASIKDVLELNDLYFISERLEIIEKIQDEITTIHNSKNENLRKRKIAALKKYADKEKKYSYCCKVFINKNTKYTV